MLLFSNSFYTADNGSGYALDERDAICSKCHNVVDRQEKYRGINEDYKFSSNEKSKWNNCPYCGEKLFE
jgi:DNA-directed RNA polymerase subunit RPC12/RpoP